MVILTVEFKLEFHMSNKHLGAINKFKLNDETFHLRVDLKWSSKQKMCRPRLKIHKKIHHFVSIKIKIC